MNINNSRMNKFLNIIIDDKKQLFSSTQNNMKPYRVTSQSRPNYLKILESL